MKLSKILEYQKIFKFCCLGVAGVALILLLIGIIANLWVLTAFGIILLIAGLLGAYVIWTYEKMNFLLKDIAYAVTNDKITSVPELASKFSLREAQIRSILQDGFNKGCFDGYIRIGESILLKEDYEKSLNEKDKKNIKTFSKQCPHCGANYIATEYEDICPYCTR